MDIEKVSKLLKERIEKRKQSNQIKAHVDVRPKLGFLYVSLKSSNIWEREMMERSFSNLVAYSLSSMTAIDHICPNFQRLRLLPYVISLDSDHMTTCSMLLIIYIRH